MEIAHIKLVCSVIAERKPASNRKRYRWSARRIPGTSDWHSLEEPQSLAVVTRRILGCFAVEGDSESISIRSKRGCPLCLSIEGS